MDKDTFKTTQVLPNLPGSVISSIAGRNYPLSGASTLFPQYYPYTEPLMVLYCGGSDILEFQRALDNCVSIQPEVAEPTWTIERMVSPGVPFSHISQVTISPAFSPCNGLHGHSSRWYFPHLEWRTRGSRRFRTGKQPKFRSPPLQPSSSRWPAHLPARHDDRCPSVPLRGDSPLRWSGPRFRIGSSNLLREWHRSISRRISSRSLPPALFDRWDTTAHVHHRRDRLGVRSDLPDHCQPLPRIHDGHEGLTCRRLL